MPDFSSEDVAEARQLHARLAWTPRFRMKTTIGRVALTVMMWAIELVPLVRSTATRSQPELRTISVEGGMAKLRVFRPPASSTGVILHFHGGGWTIGNARMSDGENAEMAVRLGATVVAVDYRVARANSIKSLIAECAAVTRWVMEHAHETFGSDEIVVKGSSAGSHLAVAAMLRLRNAGHDLRAIRGTVLYYGLYDFSGTPMVREAGSDVVILDAPTVRRTLQKLTPDMTDPERRAGWLSPLYAELTGMPTALILVGERDMLLEDNRRLAERWNAANGDAQLLVAPASPHAFDRFHTRVARKVRDHADAWMRARLAA